MLPELGHFCLILALCLATMQLLIFGLGYKLNLSSYLSIRATSLGQVFFVLIAVTVLAFAFLYNDFSVQYVAHNSNSALPWYFKFTAIWGAHEGSLLLWILMLEAWSLAVVLASNKWPAEFTKKVLVVLSALNIGLLLLLLKTSNPFLRYMQDTPLDGADLNPLLQDIGMILHPPVLYAGYVGSCIGFAFAIAALIEGKVDQNWARLLRPWVLISWIFLTLGITLGSWWAYYELGWGGWWFWDPVENASFMPWLTCTALMHCLALSSKNGMFLRLGLFLAIITFGLSILGTFLVRSGLISSVHAFASDPARGLFLLQFLAFAIGGGLFMYAWRAPSIITSETKIINFNLRSTAGAILANNVILLVAAATVLLGTLFPLIYDVLFNQSISVGYPYFNAVFIPLMLIMLLILLPTILPNLKLLFTVAMFSLIAAVLILNVWFNFVLVNAALGLTLVFAIITSTYIAWRKNPDRNKVAMSIAHIGLAITVLGISISPAYEIEQDLRLTVGEEHKIKDYNVTLQGIKIFDGANYIAYQADFIVSKSNKIIAHLKPEKRLYLAQEQPMTETAILPGLIQDLYIALGQQLDSNQWSVRIYYKPFVRCIWLGAIIMVLGASYGLLRRQINAYK